MQRKTLRNLSPGIALKARDVTTRYLDRLEADLRRDARTAHMQSDGATALSAAMLADKCREIREHIIAAGPPA